MKKQEEIILEQGPDGVFEPVRQQKHPEHAPPVPLPAANLLLGRISVGPFRTHLFVNRRAILPIALGMSALGFLAALMQSTPQKKKRR